MSLQLLAGEVGAQWQAPPPTQLSLQQHKAAQDQLTHQRHPEGIQLQKTMIFWFLSRT
jgi:hypothetical protein